METKLVKTGELQEYIDELLVKQKEIVEDCGKMLPHIRDATIKKSIERQRDAAKILVEALGRGYIPLPSTWGFHRTDAKSKWDKRAVEQTLRTMPEEVKRVWEKVKAEGFFDSFSVTVRGGGDPLLVGNKGKHRFLIAGWLHIADGYNMGFTVKK